MVKGLQTIGGKWYYMDTEGRMATRLVHRFRNNYRTCLWIILVTLTPGQDGALKYPGASCENLANAEKVNTHKAFFI